MALHRTARTARTARTMKPERVPVEHLRRNLGAFVHRARYGGERFVVTVHGKPVAELVGLPDVAPKQRKAVKS